MSAVYLKYRGPRKTIECHCQAIFSTQKLKKKQKLLEARYGILEARCGNYKGLIGDNDVIYMVTSPSWNSTLLYCNMQVNRKLVKQFDDQKKRSKYTYWNCK